jgi:hypothetical protein
MGKNMSDIRYFCMSDLHLGAENSLLTRLIPVPGTPQKLVADPTTAIEVMVRLADCLKLLLSQNRRAQKPMLILDGNALELALADVNPAAMVFERVMELRRRSGAELFDQTIHYNPGRDQTGKR